MPDYLVLSKSLFKTNGDHTVGWMLLWWSPWSSSWATASALWVSNLECVWHRPICLQPDPVPGGWRHWSHRRWKYWLLRGPHYWGHRKSVWHLRDHRASHWWLFLWPFREVDMLIHSEHSIYGGKFLGNAQNHVQNSFRWADVAQLRWWTSRRGLGSQDRV